VVWSRSYRVAGRTYHFPGGSHRTEKEPVHFLLKSSKVPYSLLRDVRQEASNDLLTVESYESTFGKKSVRKRPKISHFSVEALAQHAQEREEKYDAEKDGNIKVMEQDFKDKAREPLLSKGQSKRIWNELHKVR
jgi:nuclear GTP-binding protein